MAKNTERLDLYMKDPETDGNDTFNITTMLNNNWDKIDEKVAMVDEKGKVVNKDGSIAGGVTSVNDKDGDVTISKNDVGLNNVDNVKQATKDEFNEHNEDDTRHITTSERTLWNNKVDKVSGKTLSTEDYTTAEKDKLSGIAPGANNYTHPVTHPPSIIAQNSTNRFVTDAEKANWNAKETPSGAQGKVDTHANLTNNPHSVTKSQVGLGSVDNVKQATKIEFDAHNSDSAKHISTAERTTWNNHRTATDNPHNVTKSQVGLGSVQNYDIATKVEAEVGTNNAKYMTPLRVAESVDTHANLTSNPHSVTAAQVGAPPTSRTITAGNGLTGGGTLAGNRTITLGTPETITNSTTNGVTSTGHTHALTVTKADVGLGSVQNYGIATQAEAQAGTVNNRYMTPLRTTNLIFSQFGREDVELGLGAIAQNIFNQFFAVAIGHNSFSQGGVAIGQDSQVRGGGVAIGYNSEVKSAVGVALGDNAVSNNARVGVLGSSANNNQNVSQWQIPGSLSVSGTKNFEIPHPKPDKNSTHVMRHGAVETPSAGDNLYRYKITATKNNDKQYIELPDYFIHLNKNVQIFVTPQGHFGNGFGELDSNNQRLEISCQFEGEYNVLVIGTRNDDHQSVQDWDIKGVEREIGESWTGETYVFEVDEILEIEEIKEESA